MKIIGKLGTHSSKEWTVPRKQKMPVKGERLLICNPAHGSKPFQVIVDEVLEEEPGVSPLYFLSRI